MSGLTPGQVVADRFEIEREAGRGGMGVVYRGLDRRSGAAVALKVLHATASQAGRFAREADVLAELDHPSIVRYIAHGDLAAGAAYIALEWLEGEDLATRIARAGLTTAEAVRLALHVAEALAAAHALGVVHRDIKPSNLFLVGGRVEGVKLLDFGVARVATATHTQTGTILGTPAYMAPEQARGERGVDARADIFALGAVLYECLTGKPPFAGEHVMAILAKILLEEAPHVRWARPELPQALDDLVARMLAKDPDERPRNATAVMTALGELRDLEGGERSPTSRSGMAITTSEQRLVTIVLGTRPGLTMPTWDVAAPTLADEPPESVDFGELAEAHGLGFVPMLGSSWIATAPARASARDQAGRAARFALAARAVAPRAVLAVVTGRGLSGESVPIGEVIDRAVATVKRAARRTTVVDGDEGRPVRVDEITAGLLDTRFLLSNDRDGRFLFGIQREAPARTLLGRRVPMVGRDRELGLVASLLDECVNDGVARALVVIGESGMGKSRLVQEAIERARARHPSLQVWSGRADSMSAGSAFGLLASAIRGAYGLVDGGPASAEVPEAPRWGERIVERVSRHVAPAEVRRVSEFIGELVGHPFQDAESVELRAARADAVLLGDQMRRAWEDLILAESAAAPVALVLEDLHWGDLSTVRFVDAALRTAKERPLLVLATARPEIRETFPSLWRDRATDELKLSELSAPASRRLVREVLGTGAAPDLVERMVTRAGGHALHLEELLRAAALGQECEAPTSVVAMVEARIDRLDVVARRVLRAASVFGEVCWLGGVCALLTDLPSAEVGRWVRELCVREHLAAREAGRFPSERELGFRHAIVREAAYGMLPERDRVTGHRLAAEWLEAAGERDPVVLAEHFERGGQPSRAIAGFRRAAEEALRGDDLEAVFSRVERAIACGAVGEELGMLRLLQADAELWRGDTLGVAAAADEALRHLPDETPGWFRARGRAVVAAGRGGNVARLHELGVDLLARPIPEPITLAWVECTTEAVVNLLRSVHLDLAEALVARMGAADAFAEREPAAAGHIHRAWAWVELYRGDDVASLGREEAAAESFRRAGDVRSECRHRAGAAYQRMLLGDYAGAEADLRAAQVSAERMGLGGVVAEAKHNLGHVLGCLGRLEEAAVVEGEALAMFEALDKRMTAACHKYLAMILLDAGRLEDAERHARAAIAVPELAPTFRPHVHAALADVLVARGDVAGALAASRIAIEVMAELPVVEEGEAFVRVTRAKVLAAAGEHAAARAAAGAARDHVLRRAAKIRDPEWRQRFLEKVPECAAALRLTVALEGA